MIPKEAEFAFSIYDSDGSNKIDAYDLGDLLRALNTNPTLALIEKMGGTKKRGEKLLTLEEFLPIYGQVKKEKEQGCYEDFLECLKLYDKNEDGTMLLAELNHTLLALGNYIAKLFSWHEIDFVINANRIGFRKVNVWNQNKLMRYSRIAWDQRTTMAKFNMPVSGNCLTLIS